MSIKVRVVATAIAAAIASASLATPSEAFFSKKKYFFWKFLKHKKKKIPHGSSSSTGPIVVGCVMGSALGLITSALLKKTGELTNDEAALIAFTCGLGAFAVIPHFKDPVVSANN